MKIITICSNLNYFDIFNYDLKNCDLILISFNVFKFFRYEDEINGESNEISKIVELSKYFNTKVICGISCDLFGKMNQSLIICDNGKLLSIVESNYSLNYYSDFEFNFLNVQNDRFIFVVDKDFFDINLSKYLLQVKSSYVVIILNENYDEEINSIFNEIVSIINKPIILLLKDFVLSKNIEIITL
jgi:hypothetical protein